MFPREFIEWLVQNCWYNEIDGKFGVAGNDDLDSMTLDGIYFYWLTETKEDKSISIDQYMRMNPDLEENNLNSGWFYQQFF